MGGRIRTLRIGQREARIAPSEVGSDRRATGLLLERRAHNAIPLENSTSTWRGPKPSVARNRSLRALLLSASSSDTDRGGSNDFQLGPHGWTHSHRSDGYPYSHPPRIGTCSAHKLRSSRPCLGPLRGQRDTFAGTPTITGSRSPVTRQQLACIRWKPVDRILRKPRHRILNRLSRRPCLIVTLYSAIQ